MEWVDLSMRMEIIMRASLRTLRLMDLENIQRLQAGSLQDSGSTTFRMVKESKSGEMATDSQEHG
jgi:hypothetical protein